MKRDWRWRKQSLYSLSSFYSFFFFSLEETGREIIETSLSLFLSLYISTNKSFFTIGPSRDPRNCRLCLRLLSEIRLRGAGHWKERILKFNQTSPHPHPDEIGKIFCRDPTVNREKNSSETRVKIIDGSSSSFFFLSFFFAMLRGPNFELEKFVIFLLLDNFRFQRIVEFFSFFFFFFEGWRKFPFHYSRFESPGPLGIIT